jgi:hypothetical protein
MFWSSLEDFFFGMFLEHKVDKKNSLKKNSYFFMKNKKQLKHFFGFLSP